MPQQPITIAATGLGCPLPALQLAKAVRENGPGTYRLEADDPAAQTDIPALCEERGWRLVDAGDNWFLVRA